MGYVSLLMIPFLWLAWLPLGDGDGWHVLRVIRGHARAFWISPGMDEDQMRRLLGEDGVPGFVALHCPLVTEREYLRSEIGVIFEKKKVILRASRRCFRGQFFLFGGTSRVTSPLIA